MLVILIKSTQSRIMKPFSSDETKCHALAMAYTLWESVTWTDHTTKQLLVVNVADYKRLIRHSHWRNSFTWVTVIVQKNSASQCKRQWLNVNVRSGALSHSVSNALGAPNTAETDASSAGWHARRMIASSLSFEFQTAGPTNGKTTTSRRRLAEPSKVLSFGDLSDLGDWRI